MSPHHDHRPGRGGTPTVQEIAALTARLRDLSWRGSNVDPGERAAFLADKDALIARILDAQQDDASGPHSHTVPPERVAAVEMPEWMSEQARRTEAAIAAGRAGPVRADDLAAFTARMEALRKEIAARDAASPAQGERERPIERQPCGVVIDAEQQGARREQLARWHTADATDADAESRDVWDGQGLP